MRVVAYCRVSTEEEEQLKSFNEQQEHFKYYCSQKEGYNLLKTYADRGRSGKNVNREQFQAMLYDAGLDVIKQKKGNKYNFELSDRIPLFDYILVKDVSRFSRNTGDGVQIVSQLREKGVHILFEANNIDTKDIQGDSNNITVILNMLFSSAESESQMTSLRQKKANLSRLERGIFIFKTLPYGYKKDEKGEVVQVEEQAKVVQYVFNRVKEVGLRTISKELGEQGIKPLKAKHWSYNVLKTMVSNTLYYGTVTALKRKREQLTSVRKKTDVSEQKVIPNQIKEPILTYEEWKEANDAFLGRRNENGKGNKPSETPDIFSKKLVCGYCGSKLVRNNTKANEEGKKYYNYTCQAKREKRICDLKNLSLKNMKGLFDSVEPVFTTHGFGTANTGEIIYQKIQLARETLGGRVEEAEEELFKLMKKIRGIQSQIIEASDVAVKAEWKEMLSEITDKKNEVEKKILLLKSNNLGNLEKLTKATKQRMMELSQTNFTEEQKLEQLNFVEVFDERVKIYFDSLSYQRIIDELNTYLTDNEKIHDTIESKDAMHELFKSEKHAREYYESREQS